MRNVLQIRGLEVAYSTRDGQLRPVLKELDLDIALGDSVGIFGSSGAGKTTLARTILRLLPASASIRGTMELSGLSVLDLSFRALEQIRGRHVSLIPQEPSVALNPLMKTGRQIEEVFRAHRSLARQRLRDESRNLLHGFFGQDADRIADRYPHELSGGERQRVVICQAIACGPSLLIADEPATALDSVARKAFLDLLRQLREERGLSLLMISHNLAALRYSTDRCLELREGRLSQ